MAFSSEGNRLVFFCRLIGIKIREDGVVRTFISGAIKLYQKIRIITSSQENNLHPFDLKYGTDTSGIVDPWALDIQSDISLHAIRYQTAIVEVFVDILNSISIPHEEFIFIDLGSGKGRALLLASQFPFKEIIGVELSPKLHEIACRNIQIYRDEHQQCFKLLSVCQDATSFEIPDENVVFYMFNPFDEHVMRAVAKNIEIYFQRFYRKMYLVYLKPSHRKIFDNIKILRTMKDTGRYVIYERIFPLYNEVGNENRC